jgi:hypothetical protein
MAVAAGAPHPMSLMGSPLGGAPAAAPGFGLGGLPMQATPAYAAAAAIPVQQPPMPMQHQQQPLRTPMLDDDDFIGPDSHPEIEAVKHTIDALNADAQGREFAKKYGEEITLLEERVVGAMEWVRRARYLFDRRVGPKSTGVILVSYSRWLPV